MAALVSFFAEGDEPIKPPESAKGLLIEQRPLSDADRFEIGYAEPGVAYVRHPENDRRLLPLASYHPQILMEKANEAILMLTFLGASSIELSYSNKLNDQARADVEMLFGLISLRGGKNRNEDTTLVFSAVSDGSPPRALPPLTWIEQPGWRGIIEGRLHSGLREFAVSFTYNHQSGVDTELAAKVKHFGLRAGGEFRKSHRVSFNLQGQFPPQSVVGATDTADEPTDG